MNFGRLNLPLFALVFTFCVPAFGFNPNSELHIKVKDAVLHHLSGPMANQTDKGKYLRAHGWISILDDAPIGGTVVAFVGDVTQGHPNVLVEMVVSVGDQGAKVLETSTEIARETSGRYSFVVKQKLQMITDHAISFERLQPRRACESALTE